MKASAKSINIQVGEGKDKSSTPSKVVEVVKSIDLPDEEKNEVTVILGKTLPNKLSLVSQAKRDHARKMLMSGFVRGREIPKSEAEEKLEQSLKEQDAKRKDLLKEGKKEKSLEESLNNAKIEENPVSLVVKPSKEEKAKAKEEKRKRKEEKRLKKEAKEAKASSKAESSKKRKRKEDGDKDLKREARAEKKKRKSDAKES